MSRLSKDRTHGVYSRIQREDTKGTWVDDLNGLDHTRNHYIRFLALRKGNKAMC